MADAIASQPGPAPGPLAAATAHLLAWLAEVSGASVRVGVPPRDDEPPATVWLWPLELASDGQTSSGTQREPLRLRMRYIVSAGPVGAGLLDRVLAAAATAGEPSLVADPPTPHLWAALGAVPHPVLLLDIPLRVERRTPTVPLVRQPLRIDGVPLRSLSGQVVGPGEVPLPGVRVELITTGAATYTDTGGRFRFPGLPAGVVARLRLHGRGRELLAEVAAASIEPVVIHCDIEES